MAVLEIKKAGDPVLKKVCEPVAHIDKNLRKMLDDMAETMKKADGVGIAAPQVGKPIRAVVIDAGEGIHELINPEITFKEGTVKDTEGCLSVPEYCGEVQRFARVKVKFLNRWGKKQHLTAEGLLARCIQHELDHLEGKLFIDVAENLRLREENSK